MPRKDSIHDAVRNALVKDGWIILDDPYRIVYDDIEVYADLHIEKTEASQQIRRTLVIEIKAFTSRSPVSELEKALGQYQLYRSYLRRIAPDEKIYLAVDSVAYLREFTRLGFRTIIEDYKVALLIVDITKGEIVEWKD